MWGRSNAKLKPKPVELVQNQLKQGVAQGLSGARYEYYKAFPLDLLELMVQKGWQHGWQQWEPWHAWPQK